jgi:hypothetical protein
MLSTKLRKIGEVVLSLNTAARAAGEWVWACLVTGTSVNPGGKSRVMKEPSYRFFTVEHTIGGSFSMNAGLGGGFEYQGGLVVELTAQATVNLTQTMSKTETRSKGFELNVDLSGLEYKGITDYKDRPILPAEKVDRYRFMSFYLEGSTNHFQDFFNFVVDPEWLASNDEEARALRQAQAGKPNKTWRVLHRVTYVERPALMGFGRDIRQLNVRDENVGIGKVIVDVASLQQKVDKILEWIDSQSGDS